MTQTSDEFYAGRIGQFDAERKIFNEFLAMIAPSRGELHVLDWEYRQGQDNAKAVVVEKDRVKEELMELKKEYFATKVELNDLQEAQGSRQQQIKRLSELSQPVQRDTTYLIQDRFLGKKGRNESYSGVTVMAQNKKKTEKIGANEIESTKHYSKQVRTGEIIQLEARLEEETRKTASTIHELSCQLKEVMSGNAKNNVTIDDELEKKRQNATTLVKDLDRLDYQGFLSISELLHLRLKIMVAQREEVEELERLHEDRNFFISKETLLRDQLVSDMHLMKRRLRNEVADSTKDFISQRANLDKLLDKLRIRQSYLLEEDEKSGGRKEKLKAYLLVAKERYLTAHTHATSCF